MCEDPITDNEYEPVQMLSREGSHQSGSACREELLGEDAQDNGVDQIH